MRVGIVGSRDYPDMGSVRDYVTRLAKREPDAVVVSGGARGVDTVAATTARALGLAVEEFRVTDAEWKRLGKRAGPIRNARLVESADRLVAFWDGKSTGTMDAVAKAKAAGKLVTVKKPGEAWVAP